MNKIWHELVHDLNYMWYEFKRDWVRFELWLDKLAEKWL